MEMPEGWKRAREYFSIHINGAYLSPQEFFSEKDLELMKEMANIMALMVRQLDEYDELSTGAREQLVETFLKFKNWK